MDNITYKVGTLGWRFAAHNRDIPWQNKTALKHRLRIIALKYSVLKYWRNAEVSRCPCRMYAYICNSGERECIYEIFVYVYVYAYASYMQQTVKLHGETVF